MQSALLQHLPVYLHYPNQKCAVLLVINIYVKKCDLTSENK